METKQILQQGVAAAKAGQRREARALFKRAIQLDDTNEQAWLWLSAVLDDPSQQRMCLERVLKINPANARAQKGLAWLKQNHSSQQRPTTASAESQSSSQPSSATARPLKRVASPPQEPSSAPSSAPSTPSKSPKPSSQHKEQPKPRQQQTVPATQPAPKPQAPSQEDGLAARLKKKQTASSATSPAATTQKHGLETLRATEPPPTPKPETKPEPAPTPAKQRRSASKEAKEAQDDLKYHCPWCGARTSLEQKRCPACKTKLVRRVRETSRRSVALSFLGGAWGIGSLFAALVNLKLFGDDPSHMFALFMGMLSFGLAVALLYRQIWAYPTVIIATIALLLHPVHEYIWMVILPLLVWIPLSYRDFFGPEHRIVPILPDRRPEDHFAAGRRYQEHGMWYMAVQEWRAAAQKDPANVPYLMMLGQGYVRLKQYDTALQTLRTAHELDPANQHLATTITSIQKLQTAS